MFCFSKPCSESGKSKEINTENLRLSDNAIQT